MIRIPPTTVRLLEVTQPDARDPFMVRTLNCSLSPAKAAVDVTPWVELPLVAVVVTVFEELQDSQAPFLYQRYWTSYPVITPEAPLHLMVAVSPIDT